jgi:hypothetical protein
LAARELQLAHAEQCIWFVRVRPQHTSEMDFRLLELAALDQRIRKPHARRRRRIAGQFRRPCQQRDSRHWDPTKGVRPRGDTATAALSVAVSRPRRSRPRLHGEACGSSAPLRACPRLDPTGAPHELLPSRARSMRRSGGRGRLVRPWGAPAVAGVRTPSAISESKER